jgi:hypothetical protein
MSLVLALVAVCLVLTSLTAPAPGLAAAKLAQQNEHDSPAAHGVALTVSDTMFLPLITRPAEPIVPNIWQAEYYTGNTPDGVPEYMQEEARIDYDWGDDGAPPGLPKDHFSIRWSGHWEFDQGEYTFFVYADDGVRLWLDDNPLIDAWTAGMGPHQAKVSGVTAGLHKLKLEYFENTGEAAIRLHWRRTDLYPEWHGDYYKEPWVEGGFVDDRNDSVIQFDWGLDCPDLVFGYCDSFSIAWKATRFFEPGTHRFFIYADEGYQLFVDGAMVKEGGWHDGQPGGGEDTSYVLEVDSLESHQLTYNFHDRGTLAEARLWIVHMAHPTWMIEFYENKTLSGSPTITDPDGYKVFFDWGSGRPRKEMPSNGFSIRWSGPRYFHAGCYRFGFFADDGVRLWVDGELLVDQWHDGRGEYHSPVTYLNTGYHDVTIEYYENTGDAEIRFWWE